MHSTHPTPITVFDFIATENSKVQKREKKVDEIKVFRVLSSRKTIK